MSSQKRSLNAELDTPTSAPILSPRHASLLPTPILTSASIPEFNASKQDKKKKSFSAPKSADHDPQIEWRCKECGVKAHETPLKRRGPDGKRNICNACYVRWRVRMERAERGTSRPIIPPGGYVMPLRSGLVTSINVPSGYNTSFFKNDSPMNNQVLLTPSPVHQNLLSPTSAVYPQMQPYPYLFGSDNYQLDSNESSGYKNHLLEPNAYWGASYPNYSLLSSQPHHGLASEDPHLLQMFNSSGFDDSRKREEEFTVTHTDEYSNEKKVRLMK